MCIRDRGSAGGFLAIGVGSLRFAALAATSLRISVIAPEALALGFARLRASARGATASVRTGAERQIAPTSCGGRSQEAPDVDVGAARHGESGG